MHYPKHNTSFIAARKWLNQSLPFALYRLPLASKVKGIYQNDDSLVVLDNLAQTGFVFAPFFSNEKPVLLRPDTLETYAWEPPATRNAESDNLSHKGKPEHLALIQKGLSEIANGKLEKVVVSRRIEVLAKPDPFNTFEALLNSYSHALVYFFHHPKIGTWMGATPERFLEVNNKKLLTTSLAGTLPVQDHTPPQWTIKEIEEQQVVTEFIRSRLLKHVKTIQIGTTSTVQSGKVWHLKTEIEAELHTFQDVDGILRALHPTPAVCGTPLENAREFILQQEHYDREFYTGFLGELNLHKPNNLQLYVNLRCMKLTGERTFIFVGGGITRDSDPEREWLETQHKSRTMLDAL